MKDKDYQKLRNAALFGAPFTDKEIEESFHNPVSLIILFFIIVILCLCFVCFQGGDEKTNLKGKQHTEITDP